MDDLPQHFTSAPVLLPCRTLLGGSNTITLEIFPYLFVSESTVVILV
jgi:hypothetical protein